MEESNQSEVNQAQTTPTPEGVRMAEEISPTNEIPKEIETTKATETVVEPANEVPKEVKTTEAPITTQDAASPAEPTANETPSNETASDDVAKETETAVKMSETNEIETTTNETPQIETPSSETTTTTTEVKEENKLVRKRIEDHEKNKAAVQDKLKEICTELLSGIDNLETKLSTELEQAFKTEDARLQEIIQTKTNENVDEADKKIEYTSQKYTVTKNSKTKEVKKMVRLKIKKIENNEAVDGNPADILKSLSEQHNESKEKAKGKISKLCNELKEEVKALEEQIKSDLEGESESEDEKFSELLAEKETDEKVMLDKLIMGQIYKIEENEESTGIKDKYTLVASKGIWGLEEMKINEFYIKDIKDGKVYIIIKLFDQKVQDVLEERGVTDDVTVRVSLWKKGEREETLTGHILDKESNYSFSPNTLKEKAIYCAQVRMEYEDQVSDWSRVVEYATPKFSELCGWKKCPDYIEGWRQYVIDEDNPKIAKSHNDGGANDYSSAIVGNVIIPLGRITTWNIKVSSFLVGINGKGIYIGVAPFDIDQSDKGSFLKGGWFFYCHDSTLQSGPPHNYHKKEYGPRKKNGHYIKGNDAVGVIVNTDKRTISFALKYENIGVAYEGVPIDKPLVPFAFTKEDQISFEFDFTEIKKIAEEGSGVPAPANISVTNSAWGSITLSWDNVDGASFYQIETVENGWCDGTTSNKFTREGLRPETEYNFRVRAVRGNEAGTWSSAVIGKTTATPALSEYAWKECPEGTIEDRKYSLDEKNPLVVIKCGTSGGYSTIITSIPLPSNNITSWNIKILKSKDDNGRGIFVGVAPYDIYQQIDNEYKFTYNKCGWYFDCYNSTLRSGSPHYYCGERKFGGIRDKKDGEYVRNGETVGVIMDTKSGKLCFSLGAVNLGVAYKGIPFDKPLVPCVLVEAQGDSVEIGFNSEVTEQACIIS